MIAPSLAVGFLLSRMLVATTSDAAVVYIDRAVFEADLLPETTVVETFDALPVNASGFAALGNGAAFPGFTLTSLAFAADTDLTNGVPPVDTGLDGTFLLRSDAGNVLVLPGGGGSPNPGTPADDDDFRVELRWPAEAAGIGIVENNVGPANGDGSEWVRFLDEDGFVIVEAALPVSTTLARRFVGAIVEPGDPPIAAIEINEGDVLDDDIGFDDVAIAAPEPVAGLVWGLALLAVAGRNRRLDRRSADNAPRPHAA